MESFKCVMSLNAVEAVWCTKAGQCIGGWHWKVQKRYCLCTSC